ncbi:dihydropteroate synthase [Aeromicrobium fastidiosum]|uniref:Dihydropteroate synthase n=2 Tax=Aeromicrobium fastidiosum TaxID=52699 RepID=A0A641AT94_9ACTN|nr:dihydropteroate synthase [Aeromicrobium fastidiosum]KAA1380882.1 dihydropteroate synthase [Aeromicrobium fastidiosum]
MGVVNVTPDSFSDGGRWLDAATAIEHGVELVADGADIVDVGGESTRPGALRIDEAEEARRVLPVIEGLVAEGIRVSVDTMRSGTARRALDAGASIINDVSGGRADPAMMALAAETRSPVVLMHWREHSASMQKHTHYDDLVGDIRAELLVQVDAALAAGVDPAQIVLDPGLGFSKTGDQNWTVLAHLDAFVSLGHPLLVAASRKGFLGDLLADDAGPRPAGGRDAATAAVTTLAAAAGAWCVRVHEVGPSADAVRVVARLAQEPR